MAKRKMRNPAKRPKSDKPHIVVHVVFFEGSPGLSWSAHIFAGGKCIFQLSEGRIAHDSSFALVAALFEELGAEVLASRYKAGKWTNRRPWRWFNRFKTLGMEAEDDEGTL